MFALFAAMSPVMLLANTISDRRANRDRARRDRSNFLGELDAFEVVLAASADEARRHQRESLPDLAM